MAKYLFDQKAAKERWEEMSKNVLEGIDEFPEGTTFCFQDGEGNFGERTLAILPIAHRDVITDAKAHSDSMEKEQERELQRMAAQTFGGIMAHMESLDPQDMP